MKYTKINMKNYNLHVIKTDKFKTISVKVNFKRLVKKEELTKRIMLIHTLTESTKKYPTKRDLEIETENLYNLSFYAETINSGRYGIISLNAKFLNEKYTEKTMMEKSIEFLNEIIFRPNIINNNFEKNSFNLAKRYVKDEIDSLKDNPSRYSVYKAYEAVNPNNPALFNSVGYKKDLKQITSENLFEYYENFIDNDIVDIFVVGNIDVDNIKEIFEKNFIIKDRNSKSEKHLSLEKNIGDKKVVKEKLPINQGKLVVCYNFENLTDFENRYVSTIYSFILGGCSDSKLFKNIREKESLCYQIHSTYSGLSGILTVFSGVDFDKMDSTIDLIEKEIEAMKRGEFTLDDIKKGIKIYTNSCIELLDSPNSIINLYCSTEYLGSALIKEKLEEVNKITKEDIVKFANKIHLNKIFELKGTLK